MLKKYHFIEKIIFFINLFFVLLLLLSYLVNYIPPKFFPKFSILGLFLPFFLVVNGLFSVYWLFRRKKLFLISAVAVLLGYSHLKNCIQFVGFSSDLGENISIMSFNSRLFNHYNWNSDKELSQRIIDFISAQTPDILVVQEFFKNKKYEPDYPFRRIISKNKSDKIAHAVFSKFPIIRAGSLDFPHTSNNATFADIAINQDTIRVYSLHLESLHIPEDPDLLHQDKDKLLKNISERFVLQQEQAEIFKAHQQKSPYKIIVCGDFNNTAYSYVYRKIKGETLVDAFTQAGRGLGRTFQFESFPFRIDYILMDNSLKINGFTTFEEKLSDHFPIMAKFSVFH